MNLNIRYPNITGISEKEQLVQVKSFLIQLVDQLNYALSSTSEGSAQTYEVQGGEMSYYDLRSLIVQQLQEARDMLGQLSQKYESEFIKDDELPKIIEDVLAQAKASGEFDGPPGPKGNDGTGVTILGSYDTEEDLFSAHPTGNAGDSYLVKDDLYVWAENVSKWENVGNIKGPDGVSPIVTVNDIYGGHRVTITDASKTQSFDVMDGIIGMRFKLDDGTILY